MKFSSVVACASWLLGAVIFAGEPPAVPPLLPVEDFARADISSGLALSRDGRTIAYSSGLDRDWITILRDWETGKTRDIGNGAGALKPIWTSAERLLTGGGLSMNRDGKELAGGTSVSSLAAALVAPQSVMASRIEGPNAGDVLVLRYDPQVVGFRQLYYVPSYPHVDRVNLRTSAHAEQVKNPGGVVSWLADENGLVRVGSDTKGVFNRVIWRDRDGGEWRVPPGLDYARNQFFPLWLSADGHTLFLAQRTEGGTWGLFSYNLKEGRTGEIILGHDTCDLMPAFPVLAPRTRELLGLYFHTETPRVMWLDPQMAEVQKAIDQALPGRVNRITSLSDDLKRMIVESSTAREPATNYQFDLEMKSLKPIFPRRPWIKPAQMAEVFPASYKARDGQVIRGYLTVPPGRAAKNLPLVIVAHDGPVSRVVWEFDAEAQFLANRGYAVLAINYRGSTGYGRDYEEKATRHTSSVPADDLADGARWAIAQGIATPGRIGISGRGFGGTCVLLALTRDPELYRCAIGIDPITDWTLQLAHVRQGNPAGFAFWADRVGDPARDGAELRAASPAHQVEKINAPVLLVYSPGERVSRDDSRTFRAALGRLKKTHEVMSQQDDVDGFAFTAGRVTLLKRIEQFLAQNLSPAR